MIHTLDDCRTLEFPVIPDARGNLTPIEHLPFVISRVHWTDGVPGGGPYRDVHQLIVAVSGSFDVHLDDGARRRTHTLSRADVGLYVPGSIWRELDTRSANAMCLVLSAGAP
jgi:hypothetical protein